MHSPVLVDVFSATTKFARISHCRDSCQPPVGFMEADRLVDIHIRKAIPVSEAKGFLILHILLNALQPPSSESFFSGIHQCHLPRFGIFVMHIHGVVRHVKSHIRHVQEVVGEILFDHRYKQWWSDSNYHNKT